MLTIPMMTAAALPTTTAVLAFGPVSALALVGVLGTLAFLIAGAVAEVRRPEPGDAPCAHRTPALRHAA